MHLHCHTSGLVFWTYLKKQNETKKQTETKTTRQYLYNKVSIYILGKTNEVFMVGVDVRNLDINQQQHLLKEMGDKKQSE